MWAVTLKCAEVCATDYPQHPLGLGVTSRSSGTQGIYKDFSGHPCGLLLWEPQDREIWSEIVSDYSVMLCRRSPTDPKRSLESVFLNSGLWLPFHADLNDVVSFDSAAVECA